MRPQLFCCATSDAVSAINLRGPLNWSALASARARLYRWLDRSAAERQCPWKESPQRSICHRASTTSLVFGPPGSFTSLIRQASRGRLMRTISIPKSYQLASIWITSSPLPHLPDQWRRAQQRGFTRNSNTTGPNRRTTKESHGKPASLAIKHLLNTGILKPSKVSSSVAASRFNFRTFETIGMAERSGLRAQDVLKLACATCATRTSRSVVA